MGGIHCNQEQYIAETFWFALRETILLEDNNLLAKQIRITSLCSLEILDCEANKTVWDILLEKMPCVHIQKPNQSDNLKLLFLDARVI